MFSIGSHIAQVVCVCMFSDRVPCSPGYVCVFSDGVRHSPGWLQTHYIAENYLKLLVLLPPLPKLRLQVFTIAPGLLSLFCFFFFFKQVFLNDGMVSVPRTRQAS